MATYFEDNFLGTGLLSAHISDSGHSWTALYQSPANCAGLSGGSLGPVATNVYGGYQYEYKTSTIAASGTTFAVEAEVEWYKNGAEFGFVGVGLQSASGVYEYTITLGYLDGAQTYTTYIGAGGVEHVTIPSFHDGINTIRFEIDLTTSLVALYANGVQIYYGTKVQSLSAPFGVYLACGNDIAAAIHPTIRYNRVTVYDDAPTPPVVGVWWTNILKASEIP